MSVNARIEGVVFLRPWPNASGMLTFWCPGCGKGHSVTYGGGETWQWDGNTERPTLKPSVLVNPGGKAADPRNAPRCHTFVRDGRIEYLSDCEHDLAGPDHRHGGHPRRVRGVPPPMTDDTKAMTLRLDHDLATDLNIVAQVQGVPVIQVIREAITAYLARRP